MIYTYPAPGNDNLEKLLQRELGATRLTTPLDFVQIPETDLIVFLNFENNPEFQAFVQHCRIILQCRTIYVTKGPNNCESTRSGHFNMTFTEGSVLTDLPKLTNDYINENRAGLTNWKSRWRK